MDHSWWLNVSLVFQLAQPDNLQAQSILFCIGFFTNEPEHLFRVFAYRSAARRRHLFGDFDDPARGGDRIKRPEVRSALLQGEHSNNDEEEEPPYECCCHTVDSTQHVTCLHQFLRLSDFRFDCESLLACIEEEVMLTQSSTVFRHELHAGGSLLLPRRHVTKQFICHHFRSKWKSNLLAISCTAPEGMGACFS